MSSFESRLAARSKRDTHTSQGADNRERVPFRAGPDEMRYYRQWCLNNDCTMQEAMTRAMDALTERSGAMAPRRQDAKTPQCSSSGLHLSSKPNLKTTTTTTMAPRRQDASESTLPFGPVGDVKQSGGSQYSLEEILEYAKWSFENGTGINRPEQWAVKAFETGKYDVIVMQWQRERENPREALPELRPCKRCGTYFRPKDLTESANVCRGCLR